MTISISRLVMGKRAATRVVYIDPKTPPGIAIELEEPRNIWGVALPPNGWEDMAALETEH